MGTPRPTGVTVIAILAIVFGALGICGGAASLPMLAMDPSSVPDLPSLRPYFENDALRLHMKVNAVVGVTASLALVAAGIGMLSFAPGRGPRPWCGRSSRCSAPRSGSSSC